MSTDDSADGNQQIPQYPTLPEHLEGIADATFRMCDSGENPDDMLAMLEHGLKKHWHDQPPIPVRMQEPWRDHPKEGWVSLHGVPVFVLQASGQRQQQDWELRRIGSEEAAGRGRSRSELLESIQAGRIKPDYTQYAAARWPQLPAAQMRGLATCLGNGWAFVGIGWAGEVNIRRERGATAGHGYIRADGTFRAL